MANRNSYALYQMVLFWNTFIIKPLSRRYLNGGGLYPQRRLSWLAVSLAADCGLKLSGWRRRLTAAATGTTSADIYY